MADTPFMLQPNPDPTALYNAGGQPGLGHPLAQTQWFTNPGGGFPSATGTGSGIPFAPQYGGFGTNASAVPGQQPGMWGKLGNLLGNQQFQTGISTFGNLANIYMGFKSLGLAKDQLKFSKQSFNKNFNAQAQAYNNELKDRWESKSNAHATRGRSYEGMDSWLSGRTIDKVGKEGKGG